MDIRLPAVLMLCATLCSGEGDFTAAVTPGTRWERGDQVLFFGDHRWSAGSTVWAEQLGQALPRLRDDLELSGRWMGCDWMTGLPAWVDNWYAGSSIDVAVILAGATDAQAEKPPEPAAFEQYLLSGIKTMLGHGTIVILATPMPCGDKKAGNPLDERLEAYAAAVRSVASATGARLCDLRTLAATELLQVNADDKADGVFSTQTPEKRWVLTAAGHRFAAERIAAALGEAMVAAPLQIEVRGGSFAGETKLPVALRRLERTAATEIKYTIDGKDPSGKDGKPYKGPILVRDRCTLKVWATDKSTNRTATLERRIEEMKLRAADKPIKREHGLRFEMFQCSRPAALPDFDTLTPAFKGVWNAPDLGMGPDHPEMPAIKENYALRFTGLVEVPCDGIYTFYLGSDDGSRLLIGDSTLINHDGPHPVTYRSGEIGLREGLHEATVLYYQGNGTLRRSTVPDAAWWHDGKEKPKPKKPETPAPAKPK